MSMIEGLEGRRLLAASITEITPDNRGEVVIQLSEPVTGVRKSSVRMYTFGTDGIANTADDVRLNTVVNYDNARKRIVTRVIGNLDANVGYRIRIQARDVRSAIDGSQFDGEYNSDGTSGNGVGNGNYNARFRLPKSNEVPRVRFSTTAGIFELAMRRDVAPLTVANFLKYTDSGRYDGLFVNRSVSGFVVQMGAAYVEGDGDSAADLKPIERFATVQNEPNLSNVRGTVGLAKGSDPNSGSADFFVNLANNSFLDSPQNGAFTVFAQVANTSSQNVIDSIAAKTTVYLQNNFDGNPAGNVQAGLTATGLSDVPINDLSKVNSVVTEVDFNQQTQQPVSGTLVTSGLVPNRDLVVVRRAALLLKTASV